MRNFNNLFELRKIEPILEEYQIGYTKVFIYQCIEYEDEIFFGKRIEVLYKLAIYNDYILLWFDSFEQMYTDLGEYLEYEENNYDNCAEICQQILDTNPDNSVALRGLGCVAQANGNFKLALKYYKKALKTSLNKEIEYTLIGTLYYLEDKYEKAVKYFNLAIDVNDEYDEAYEGRSQSILEKHLQILDLQDSLIKKELL